MINCQKFNFLLFLTINSVTTAVRELNETCQISLVKGRNARDLDEVSSGLARMHLFRLPQSGVNTGGSQSSVSWQ